MRITVKSRKVVPEDQNGSVREGRSDAGRILTIIFEQRPKCLQGI